MNLIDRFRSVKTPASAPEGDNEFALSLLRALGPEGNLLFSPFSIRAALGMALLGAKWETADEIRGALGVQQSGDAIHADITALVRRLTASGDVGQELVVSNSLWSQETKALQAEFLELASRYYSGCVHTADFRGDPEGARGGINRWVEQSTRQRIRDLVPAGGVGADTCLALVNAVFFKGWWARQFDNEMTYAGPFHVEGGDPVTAQLMNQVSAFSYAEHRIYQAVDLAYQRSGLSMLVLLPKPGRALASLEEFLTADGLRGCVASLKEETVQLLIPQFEFTWGTADVTPALQALGMSVPFSPTRADFSGINGCAQPHTDALSISRIFHKAFVGVSEEGTEASAATAVLMETRSIAGSKSRVVFRADRPFLFFIRDRKTGAILFVGRVADPTLP